MDKYYKNQKPKGTPGSSKKKGTSKVGKVSKGQSDIRRYGTPRGQENPQSSSISTSTPSPTTPRRPLGRVNPGEAEPEPPRNKRRCLRPPTSRATADEQLEDEDSTSSAEQCQNNPDFEQMKVDPCSIHRICLDRIPLPHDRVENPFRRYDAERKRIDKIIEMYNETKRRDDESTDNLYQLVGDREKEIKLTGVRHRLMEGRDPFQTCLYIQVSKAKPSILLWAAPESNESSCDIHQVWFFYRKNEIFAITTNQAWHVVHEISDFEFPGKVAARLCSPDGPKQVEEKKLIGHVLHRTKTMKRGQSSSVFDPPVLCMNFTASLRKDASIRKIQTSFSEDVKNATYITFGFAYLRIKKQLHLLDIPIILDHLSLIASGCTTYKWTHTEPPEESEDCGAPTPTNSTTRPEGSPGCPPDSGIGATFTNRMNTGSTCSGSCSGSHPANSQASQSNSEIASYLIQSSQESFTEEPQEVEIDKEFDTNAYDRNLAQVPPELGNKLEDQLAQYFIDALNKKSDCPINAFELKYKHVKNFALAHSFQLMFKKTVMPLPVHATLKDVLNVLTTAAVEDDKVRKLLESDVKAMRQHLKNSLKIVFVTAEGMKKESSSLLSFLEGEMIFEGQIFWRVINMWCTLNPSYTVMAHTWFINFLKDHLIRDERDRKLTEKWPMRSLRMERLLDPTFDVVQLYISQYDGKDGYFRPLEKDGRLFDLMHLNGCHADLQLFFYFFASNFYIQTADLCDRIHNCLEAVKNALRKKPSGPLRDFYWHHCKQKSPGISDLSYGQFKDLLKAATVVYALSKAEPMRLIDQGPMDSHVRRRHPSAAPREPSLAKEAQLSTDISKAELQKLLSRHDCPLGRTDMMRLCEGEGMNRTDSELIAAVATLIYNELREAQYVHKNSVTVKFLYSSVRTFKTERFRKGGENPEDEQIRRKVFALVSNFQSYYSSLRAKFELRHIAMQNVLEIKFMMDEIEEAVEAVQAETNGELIVAAVEPENGGAAAKAMEQPCTSTSVLNTEGPGTGCPTDGVGFTHNSSDLPRCDHIKIERESDSEGSMTDWEDAEMTLPCGSRI